MLSNDHFKAFQGNTKDMKLLFKLRASFLLYGAADLMVYSITRKIFFCTKHFLVHVKKCAKRYFIKWDIQGLLLQEQQFLIAADFSFSELSPISGKAIYNLYFANSNHNLSFSIHPLLLNVMKSPKKMFCPSLRGNKNNLRNINNWVDII